MVNMNQVKILNRASIIRYGDQEIYLVDYTDIRELEYFKEVIDHTGRYRENLANQGKSGLLMLVDFSNSRLNMDIYDRLRRHGMLTRSLVRKEAVVGLGKFRFIVNIFNCVTGMNFKIFDDREEALKWLSECSDSSLIKEIVRQV